MTETANTLVYRSSGPSRDNSLMAMLKGLGAPAITTVAGAYLLGDYGAYGGGILGIGLGIAVWRTRNDRGGATLTVEDGVLLVSFGGPRTNPTRISLKKLHDVSLDSRTISPVMEGSAMIPQTRFIDQKSAGEVEESRIVLTIRGQPDLPLSEERGSYSDALEWLGKIRSFLRRQGWVPADER